MIVSHALGCRRAALRWTHFHWVMLNSRRGVSSTVLPDEADMSSWEDGHARLNVNWFPGHMVKATRIIREKLKHVRLVAGDMRLI